MKTLKEYLKARLNLIVVATTSLIFVVLFVTTSLIINRDYVSTLEETVYRLKQDYLHDTVNNQISAIENESESLELDYQQKVTSLEAELDHFWATNPSQFYQSATSFLNDSRRNHFYVNIYDTTAQTIIYEKAWVDAHHDQAHIIYEFPPYVAPVSTYFSSLRNDFSTYLDLAYGNYLIFAGVPRYYIEKEVADSLREQIYSKTFVNENTYMWVNKILNPLGGDNYAQRIIHPNLPQTEYTTSLSTNTLDYLGKTQPYLIELEGVLDGDGEVFFTYAFKLLNSDDVGTKLTFAKLYGKYNWVIAMGIYLEDIEPFITQVRQSFLSGNLVLIGSFLVASIILFTWHYFTIMHYQKRRLASETQSLKEEIDRDQLTAARSRKAGTIDLENHFQHYKRTGESVAIFAFDFDNFKQINDSYGHDAGDKILVGVCNEIKKSLRTTDHIYRWGGDEFIIIYYGLKKENAQRFADNVIKIANNFSCRCDESNLVHPSISVGVTYFNQGDQNYQDALKRADKALYLIKKTKKGTAFIDID